MKIDTKHLRQLAKSADLPDELAAALPALLDAHDLMTEVANEVAFINGFYGKQPACGLAQELVAGVEARHRLTEENDRLRRGLQAAVDQFYRKGWTTEADELSVLLAGEEWE